MKSKLKKLFVITLSLMVMMAFSVPSFADTTSDENLVGDAQAIELTAEKVGSVMMNIKGGSITTVSDTEALLTMQMGSASFDKARAYRSSDEIAATADNVFADIPFTLGKTNIVEFHSKKNDAWYKRDLSVDLDKAVLYYADHQIAVNEIDGMTEEESVAYVKENASVELLNALIEAIQVQNRDENTDRYCAAARECWKALDEKAQLEDDGYFSDDTGDASKDDPLNADPVKGKTELLVVSFGTSFNDSRVATIGAVEKALQKAYPKYQVRRAFTAQIIINHVASRDEEQIDNVDQAMEKAVAAGVKKLIVQPTHLMSGAEYDELKGQIDAYKGKIKTIVYSKPLLNSASDKKIVAKAVVEAAAKDAGFKSVSTAVKSKDTAFVFMGHGTAHKANATYAYMQKTMKSLGYKNCFIGTVEGLPESTALPEVKKAVEKAGYTKIVLRPLMVVAGDHANNDMAADEEGSWYYAFANGGEFEVEGQDQPVDIGAGFGAENVTCQVNGLGEIAAIQGLYVAHTNALAMHKIAGIKVKVGKKKATVSWSKNANVTGYQIYYKKAGAKAKTITVKKSVAKKTIKKLKKGKKYTFKVRGYKTIQGIKVYTQWSKKVTKKIK